MANRFINPNPQFLLSNGGFAAGASLTFYQSGTDTLLTIYSDEGETTQIQNPVLLDARGAVPDIFYSTAARVRCVDAQGNEIFDIDPVLASSGGSGGGIGDYNTNATYGVDAIVLADGDYYISLTNDNTGNDPTVDFDNNANWSKLEWFRQWNQQATYEAGDLVVRDSAIYRSLSSNNLGNDPLVDTSNWKSIANSQYSDYNNQSSGLVALNTQDAIDEIVATINTLNLALNYRGNLNVSAGDAALPTSPAAGDLYVIAVGGTITVSVAGAAPAATAVTAGEQIVYNGTTGNWDLTVRAQTAATVSYNNTASGLTASDVQSAIDELDADVATVESQQSTNTSEIASQGSRLSAVESSVSGLGTAANENIQTSEIDTSNTVMRVGGFGLGTTSGVLLSDITTNIDSTSIPSGLYRVNTLVVSGNFPAGQAEGALVCVRLGATDAVQQFFTLGGGFYQRTSTGGIWNAWIADSSTLDPSTPSTISAEWTFAAGQLLGNNQFLKGRNAADTISYNLIGIDDSDLVFVGDSARATRIRSFGGQTNIVGDSNTDSRIALLNNGASSLASIGFTTAFGSTLQINNLVNNGDIDLRTLGTGQVLVNGVPLGAGGADPAGAETITGVWTYNTSPRLENNVFLQGQDNFAATRNLIGYNAAEVEVGNTGSTTNHLSFGSAHVFKGTNSPTNNRLILETGSTEQARFGYTNSNTLVVRNNVSGGDLDIQTNGGQVLVNGVPLGGGGADPAGAETITGQWTFDTAPYISSNRYIQADNGATQYNLIGTDSTFIPQVGDAAQRLVLNAFHQSSLGGVWIRTNSDSALSADGGFAWRALSAASTFAEVGLKNGTLFVDNKVSGGHVDIKTLGGGEIRFNGSAADRLFVTSQSTSNGIYGVRNRYSLFTGGAGQTFTLNNSVMNADGVTTILANVGSAPLTIASGSFTLNWLDGSGTISTGDRTLAVGGAVTFVRRNLSNVDVFGTGLS